MGWLDTIARDILTFRVFLPFIPLIVGPAVLTMLIITVDAYGIASTLFCLALNLLIVGLAFGYSPYVMRFLREGGAKGVAKVAALLLAAYAVMMVRTGLTG